MLSISFALPGTERSVAAQKKICLAFYLRRRQAASVPRKEPERLSEIRRYPALADYSLIFLFYFDKSGRAVLRHAVGPQPQLLLIYRLFKRGAYQAAVGGVVIYTAYSASAEAVRLCMPLKCVQHVGVLLTVYKIFVFISFENCLKHLFRLLLT